MKKLLSLMILASFSMLNGCTHSEVAKEETIKKKMLASLGEGAKIDGVVKTKYSGLYEIRMGNKVIYTDEKAEYVFVGSVFSANGEINHTKARIDEINKIEFSSLPLELAMKSVRGKGERVVAIFEDPNCGYCKLLRKNIETLDNVTIYTFMYNILSEDSIVISRNMWCSSNKNQAWDDWMIHGKAAPAAPENCTAPHEAVYEFGRKHNINSTPSMVFADGSREAGAFEVADFEKKFEAVKSASVKK